MSSLESKCNLQKSRIELLKNAFEYFKEKDVASLTKRQIETRLEVLESDWSKFDKDHEKICESKPELLKNLPYFTDDYFNIAREAYMVNKSKMLDLLDSLPIINANFNHTSESQNSSTHSFATQKPILPKITLPQFEGDYQSWKAFSDLFSSLVIENSDLSDVTKMHYLKSSLIKDAAQLISSFQVSGENFAVAWAKLKSRYENKRVLISKHLDDIFKLKPITKKTSKNLSHLMSVVNESLVALKALGSPTDYWDHIIVYILVNRLDPDTHEAWELHLGTSTEPPTLQDLQTFIEGRARAFEGIEMRESIRSNTYQKTVHTSSVSKPKPKFTCLLCSENHYLSNCDAFSKKSPFNRKEYLIAKKLCFNCLGHHQLRDCHSQKSCQICKRKHHTLIHDVATSPIHVSKTEKEPQVPHISSSQKEKKNEVESIPSNIVTTNHASLDSELGRSLVVLLATAQVKVIGPHQNVITAKALIDQGSELSFISENLVQTLHLPRKSVSISLVGVGGIKTAVTRGQVAVTLSSIHDSKIKCDISPCILPKLTSLLPSSSLPQSNWSHINGLKLADPSFMKPESIDLILGADVYAQIILPELIKGPPMTPIAQSTIFGYILSGPSGSINQSKTASMYHCVSNEDIDKQLERFWTQEEIPMLSKSELSTENKLCEENFKSTYSRHESGRYEVRLPLKESSSALGDSRSSAFLVLKSLQSRFSGRPDYLKMYSDFIKEYKSLDHMSEVPADQLETNPAFYLPHHGVYRESSSTTKLRVVFNGSQRTTSGKSLNDILHSGPKLQIDLPDVLTWFRKFEYVFVTDIEKMYRQILVHPEDWNLQRILWLENGTIRTYHLKTVTYGLSCAPYLALRILDQLVIDEGDKFPLAAETLKRGRYVDDIFGGDDSIEKCVELVDQVDKLCKAGCFPLKKWVSNHPSVLKNISSDRQEHNQTLSLENSTVVKTLGLSWNPINDYFHFVPNFEPVLEVTKRNVLSRIAQFFDPLGFIAPVIISAKVFIQKLWLVKLQWDDLLPSHLISEWRNFELQIQALSNIHIPRFLGLHKIPKVLEVHGFSDASTVAMSAVIYLRVSNGDSLTVSFVCAKTKVAPLKKMSVPRLELTAATILVKLARHVCKVLDLNSYPLYLWVDSTVALTWITNPPSRWKDFVSNRVALIQETAPSARWRFVPGTENPADCASRGMTSQSLQSHKIWWNGPSWLHQEPSNWPASNFTQDKEAVLEERRQKSTHVLKKLTEPSLLTRYSSLTKLLRITAWCLIFCQKLKKEVTTETQSYLTPLDIEKAFLRWISIVQQASFQHELKLLHAKKVLDKSSPLQSLNPFVDNNGLLRVGGRLSQSSLEIDSKHPYILPKESTLSKLVILDAHLRTLHGGTRDTLALIRQKIWIIGGRHGVKKEILHCVICARYKAERAQQLMGQLPPARINPSRPFLHSGVDYAGPFVVKTWRGKNAKVYKGYVAVFVCSSTSAIHLELVTDYTSDAFIAAYKRFTARRGICATLSSDCGTTFVGASTELKRLFNKASDESTHLQSTLANDGTQWRFNPPAAPHFGGRWEAGVKSVKYHLKRVIGNHLLTYEEFYTVLTQIESVLNSRPLCRLTEDPDDLSTLTPAHFLVGESLNLVPEPKLLDIPMSRLSRWKQTRQMVESFWKKWSKEYLQQLQTIYKWKCPRKNIELGSIVLVIDENLPPAKWSLAKVVKLHPGSDGFVRVVTLKTATSDNLKRPIVKLCVLPVEKDYCP